MRIRWGGILGLVLLAACGGTTPLPVPFTPAATAAPSPTLTNSPAPDPTRTASPSPEPTAAPALACSPLEGYGLADLPGLVSNPYAPPPPGSDMPHEGADLAVLLPGTRAAVAGSPVFAALPGTVVLAQTDRFPYGSALIVETPLADLPPGVLEKLELVEIPTGGLATLEPRSALTCPAQPVPAEWDLTSRSLYLVYAHLRDAPAPRAGDVLACGQQIGVVGETGNALNPHLHLEARVGPAGARFESMAHYDASASPAEMAAYCLWRVSGLFELRDPLLAIGVYDIQDVGQ